MVDQGRKASSELRLLKFALQQRQRPSRQPQLLISSLSLGAGIAIAIATRVHIAIQHYTVYSAEESRDYHYHIFNPFTSNCMRHGSHEQETIQRRW